jgi:hypothetical protein
MFINISNHPSKSWSVTQTLAALTLDPSGIRDIQFPNVPASACPEEIEIMADVILSQLSQIPSTTVMVQGEFSLTYNITSRLIARGVSVVVACSERKSVESPNPNGAGTVKTSVFEFVQFRAVI